jgi:AcrR family transcriptional regulator
LCKDERVKAQSGDDVATEGVRERKRRQTYEAIANAGLRLFLKNGFEETTLDDIAAAAEIARRTFFAYFDSKEDILFAAIDTGFIEALRAAFADADPKDNPFDALRRVLPKMVSRFETKESIAVEHLLRSSETLRVRKQGIFLKMEQNLFEALHAVWPSKSEAALRVLAVTGIGVMRVSMDAWWDDRGKRTLAAHVRDGFSTLKANV